MKAGKGKSIVRMFDLGLLIPLVTCFGFLACVAAIFHFLKIKKNTTSSQKMLFISVSDFEANFVKRSANWILDFYRDVGHAEQIDYLFFLCNNFKKHYPTKNVTAIDFQLPYSHFLDKFGFFYCYRGLNLISFIFYCVYRILYYQINAVILVDPIASGLSGLIISGLTWSKLVTIIWRDPETDFLNSGKVNFGQFKYFYIERLIYRLALRASDLVIADRIFYLNFGLRNGAKPENSVLTKVFVHPKYYLPVSLRTDIRDQFHFEGRHQLIIYIGRLSPDKHCVDMIDALSIVVHEIQNAFLLMVGNGIQKELIHSKIKEKNLENNFLQIDCLDADTLINLTASANLVWGTHMGFTLIECALAQVPIIAYDWEWHSEFIKDGINGILIPFKNYQLFAAKTVELLRNPEKAKLLGQNARTDAETIHSWDNVTKSWEQALYHRMQ